MDCDICHSSPCHPDCPDPIRAAIMRARDDLAGMVREEAETQKRACEMVAQGIAVLRTLHGVPVTDAMCRERANNIIAGFLGEFIILRREES